jgi:type III secretory pathway component EscV
VDEVEVGGCHVPPGKVLCNESPGGLEIFEIDGDRTRHPVSRRPAAWIDAAAAEMTEQAGYATWDVAGIVLLQLTASLQNHAHQFVTIQSVRGMLDQLEGPYPALVAETVPKLIDLQTLTEVCRRLAEESISLRQMPGILDVVADRAQFITDPVELTEEVRAGLSRYITDAHAGDDGEVIVYVIDPEIERIVEGAIRRTETGSFLSLPPDVSRQILRSVRQEISPDLRAGRQPILLTSAEVRRYIHTLVALETDRCVVLSYRELDPSLRVQPLGRIAVGDEQPADAE